MNRGIGTSIVALVLSIAFQSASLGLGKQASLTLPAFTVSAVAQNPYYLASLACLGLQAVVWQVVLRRLALSTAYFFMSAVYVNIVLMSRFVFNEPVTAANVAGACIIVAGIVVLAGAGPGAGSGRTLRDRD